MLLSFEEDCYISKTCNLNPCLALEGHAFSPSWLQTCRNLRVAGIPVGAGPLTNHEIHVAIVGDPVEVPELESLLTHHGCKLHRLASSDEGLDMLGDSPVDLVLLILSKGHPERLALLQRKGVSSEFPPVVVLTDCFDVDLYVEALRRGAFDGLGVPVNTKELLRVVRAAAAEGQSRRNALAATA